MDDLINAVRRLLLVAVGFLGAMGFLTIAQAQPYADTDKGQFFIHNFDGEFGYSKDYLFWLFSNVHRDDVILRKIAKPKEKTLAWHQYRRIFLDDSRIKNGLAFYRRHQKVLTEAEQRYGVSPFIITAIIGVETRYGKFMGKDNVLTALSTIGFDYPQREKFFMGELRAYLQMVAQEGLDPFALKGSYAGAMGMAQFMPSSYLKFAVDYEGDGKRDLWGNPNDAIFSVANYLAQHGWQRNGDVISPAEAEGYVGAVLHLPFTTLGDLKARGVRPVQQWAFADNTPVGYMEFNDGDRWQPYITYHNFSVITTYNTSPLYAMAVNELANRIEREMIFSD